MFNWIIKTASSNKFGPFNLGNTNEITINKLAETIKFLVNSNSKIKYQNLPQDDPIRRKPDISKANKQLNWLPEIDLDKGLSKTINYFKAINESY